MKRNVIGLLFAILFSSGVAMAHGSGSEAAKIKIIMNEFSFQVEGAAPGEPILLKAGQSYKMVFENQGEVLHEVLIGRDMVSSHGEHDYKENLLVDQQVVLTGSSIVDEKKRFFAFVANGFVEMEMDPKLRLSLQFTVPESARGIWEMGCFAEGHHESGMFLPVVVE